MVSSHPRQSNISEHFSSSQPLPDDPDADLPPPKRLKTGQQSPNTKVSTWRGSDASAAPDMPLSALRPNFEPVAIDLTTSSMTPTPSRRVDPRINSGVRHKVDSHLFPGAKKIDIKNLKKSVKPKSEQLVERAWVPLEAALTAVFKGTRMPCCLEMLYREVEILMIQSVFYYLDRAFLVPTEGFSPIDEMATNLFKRYVFLDPKIQPTTVRAFCHLIDEERKDATSMSHASLLRDFVKMAHELGVYTSDLEHSFLVAAQKYFETWSEQEAASGDLAGYVKQCGAVLENEMARCDRYHLDSSTRRRLLSLLEELLITRQVKALVQPEAAWKLLDAQATDVLEMIYSFLGRVARQALFQDAWETYITLAGSSIVNDVERQGEMVVLLLELRVKLDHILHSSLRGDKTFEIGMRRAFATLVNKQPEGSAGHASDVRTGEMIAKYIDTLLRGGVKAIPSTLNSRGTTSIAAADDDLEGLGGDEEAELTQQLDRVLELFRSIEGKDVFEAFYKKDLARRLLLARSASADAEKSMLAKLKNGKRTPAAMGTWTDGPLRMFKDVDLAKEEVAAFKQMRQERGEVGGVDLSVNVLSSSAWPTYPDVRVIVPDDIMKAINEFDRFYKAKHKGRMLNWKHSLAHCVVRARFPRASKELIVSSFQAIVMLLFNDVPEGSSLLYGEIQAASGLSNAELIRTLQSLACAKYRVLSKTPKGREVNTTDSFSVNANFTDAKYRIKINQIQLKETKEEVKATHEDVNRDRQYECQATIVRIMKSRKAISAPELMAETINQTKKRGALDTADIKRHIDKLVEKDYLERAVDDGRMVYRYVA
ncbi:MAG: hypothetical protein M1826_005598 [Phylliscum demangeonii]|nr:MAG: hypothetical protein M1826_005598 [Phylliscum demangeonii]